MGFLLALTLCAVGADAATVLVTIMGPANGSYVLNVGPVRKAGRLESPEGPGAAGQASARELIEIDAPRASAELSFYDEEGEVSSCSPLAVSLDRGGSSCVPAFVMTGTRIGYRNFLCRSSCVPRRASNEGFDPDWDTIDVRVKSTRPGVI